MGHRVTSVVFAGIGGQGVIRASDILAEAAFLAGHDVKKSDVRGMSQRGGSVTSDVRFGDEVLSPMAPRGEVDFVVVLAPDAVPSKRPMLRSDGVPIHPELLKNRELPHPKSLNVALLGVLSVHLDIREEHWLAAVRSNLPERTHEANVEAFRVGRLAAGED